MKTITQKEFDKQVDADARQLHNKYLRLGQFWPIQVCRTEVRKKLLTQYTISNGKERKK